MNQCSKHSGIQNNPKWKVIAYQIKIFTEVIQNNDSTGVNIDAKEQLRIKQRKERKEGRCNGEGQDRETGKKSFPQVKGIDSDNYPILLNPC